MRIFMSKLINIKKVGVVITFALISSFTMAQNNDVTKGGFPERKDVSVVAYNEETVFSQTATDMASTWQYSGFTLKKENGQYAFATGNYAGGNNIYAVSGDVQLPAVTTNEEIYLSLDHDVEVEYYYDRVGVDISTDGGITYKGIYAFTGRLKVNFPTGIRLNDYAGKTVRFRLYLRADSSICGAGWSLYNFSIVKGNKSDKPAMRLKAANSGNIGFEGRELELTNVSIDDQGNGEADFYMTEADTAIFYSLDTAKIDITVNGLPAGCKAFIRPYEREKLNVVFAIDNSGSMGQYQEKVNDAMPRLINVLTKYQPLAALVRFGQTEGDGCAVVETGERSRNIFDLSKQNEFIEFVGSNNTEISNSLWSRNIQTGCKEEYYAVLNYIATAPFQKAEGAQTVVVMLGDESEFNHVGCSNDTDCKTGKIYTENGSQIEVAENLKKNGVQAFIIQDTTNLTEYDTIVALTNGKFYNIEEADYTPLADMIGNTLKYKCHITFCTHEQNCGDTIPVSISIDGVTASAEVPISGHVSVERSASTKALNNVKANTKQTVAFKLEDKCSIVETSSLWYTYGYGTTDTVTKKVDCVLTDGVASANIPAEDVIGRKISYKLILTTTEGKEVVCPDVTQSSNDWEFSIGSDAPVFGEPSVTAEELCSTKHFSIEVTDADGIADVVLYYKRLKDNVLVYESVKLSKGSGNSYSTTLSDSVSRNFKYYVVATDVLGNESVLGSEAEPLEAGYKKPEASTEKSSATLNINDDIFNGCAPLNNAGGLFQLVYLCHESHDYEVLVETKAKKYAEYIDIDNLPISTAIDDYKNGFYEGDNVKVLFTSDDTPNVTYEVGNFTFSASGNEADVCVPEDLGSIDDELKFNLDGSYTKLKSVRNGKFVYGDTLSFGKVSETTYGTITVTNKHYVPIILNRITIETKGGFTLATPVNKDQVIGIGESFAFQLAYKPGTDEVAKVSISNNSLSQNPLVFYVQGESDEKATCVEICQSVTNYQEGVLAEVITSKNLNNVCLALVQNDGDTLNTDCMAMGGPAVQGFYLSKKGMLADRVYSLVVKVDDKVCHNAFRFNEQQTADTVEVDNCKDLLKSLSVNSWGMMAEVAVESSVANMDLHVYTPSGIKTDVGFGPQLMGGPTTHYLYLGTGDLPAGSYILRVVVDNKVCSKQFVNVK